MPTTTARPHAARCLDLASVFHNPLLEEPLPSGASATLRRRQAMVTAAAEQACRDCPLITDCLYRAVVEHDVAGFAGGTTPAQRTRIRRLLGVTVQPEDFDTIAGVTGSHRQIDHDEVLRLRAANPHESLEQIAQRLGCSLSTVKRHLRRERRNPTVRAVPAPKPTVGQVLAAAATVTSSRPKAA